MKEMNINGIKFATKVSSTDIANGIKDDFGVVYSPDGERLLKCVNRTITQYTIKDGVKVICDNAFKGCTLQNIIIGDGVVAIGSYAFAVCDFNTITIGDNVTTIDEGTFQDCTRLSHVYLGNNVSQIEYNAFDNCPLLSEFEISDNNPYLRMEKGILYSKDMTKLMLVAEKNNISESIEIPETVTSIGDGAFKDCRSLKGIVIGDNVNYIGKEAFYGCRRLNRVVINGNITSLEEGIFNRCTSLTEITLPSSITVIHDSEIIDGAVKPQQTSFKGKGSKKKKAFRWCMSLNRFNIFCERKEDAEKLIKKLEEHLPTNKNKKKIKVAYNVVLRSQITNNVK